MDILNFHIDLIGVPSGGGSSSKDTYTKVSISETDAVISIDSSLKGNIIYECGTLESLTINPILNLALEVLIEFSTGDSIDDFLTLAKPVRIIPEINIEANKSYVMSIINGIIACSEVQTLVQPNDEIIYTTVNNTKTVPNDTSVFGSNYVDADSYYAGNIGLMKFDGDITSAGADAFYGNTDLKTIELPETVAIIGGAAFADCTSLENIILHEGLETIEDGSFTGDISLKSLVVPNSVELIMNDAFNGCTDLTNVIIGSGVETIEFGAFENCTSLNEVTMYSNITIGNEAFEGKAAEGRLIFNNETEEPSISLLNNFIGWNLIYNGEDRGIIEFKLPYNEIWYEASSKLPETKSSSITTPGIRTNAFSTTIKTHTFEEGKGKVVFNSNLTYIGLGAFMSCAMTSVSVPDTITHIDGSAFAKCSNLLEFYIPVSINNIGNTTFFDCTSLTSINYEGTKVQWEQVTKGSGWNTNVPATVVHCSDGDVSIE